MILGLGNDLVSIERVASILAAHSTRFVHRLLHPEEREGFSQSPHPAAFLAKRFAAKEAIVKALGTGFRDGIGFQNICILSDDLGKPEVRLDGRAHATLVAIGGQRVLLSLSDEKQYAMATALVIA